MASMTLSDDSETVEIDIFEGRVESIRISNRWRERFDAPALARSITELVVDVLPAKVVPERIEPGGDKHLPIGSVKWFTAELRLGREATRRYIARLRAGETARNQVTRVTDESNSVEVVYFGGRFAGLDINPKWAENAAVQTLCDVLLEVLGQAPLVQDDEPDPDLAEAQRHYDAARGFLVDKDPERSSR